MPMHASFVGAVAVSCVAALGTLANEATRGDVAERMGLGHHHMADHDGAHCADHAGPDAAEHMEHMHGDDATPHDSCPGGQDMHGSGMPMGGPMHG